MFLIGFVVGCRFFCRCLQESIQSLFNVLCNQSYKYCFIQICRVSFLIFWEFKTRNISQTLQQECRDLQKATYKIMIWSLKRRTDFFQHSSIILTNLGKEYVASADPDCSWEVSHYVPLLLEDHFVKVQKIKQTNKQKTKIVKAWKESETEHTTKERIWVWFCCGFFFSLDKIKILF